MKKGPLIAEGRTAEIFAWDDNMVLKLFREGFSPGHAKYEADIIHAVHSAGLNIPALVNLVEIDGRPGIILQRITGPTMMQEIVSSPEKAGEFIDILVDLQVSMHKTPVSGLPSLKKRLAYKIQHADPLPEPWKTAVLERLAPLPEGNSICHGDFHPDNIVMTPGGPVIIDWVDATQGYPLADVARTLLLVKHAASLPDSDSPITQFLNNMRHQFLEIYLAKYKVLQPFDPEELSAWQLPVTAARLSENIVEEENLLLSLVEEALFQN